MTTPKLRRTIAVLALPKPVPALIAAANHIVEVMTNNANYPNPDPSLATITGSIKDLATSQAAALARTHGAATTRNEKRAVLVTQFEQLKGSIQKVADANQENAASIIESAGLTVRKTVVRKPRAFEAAPGPVTGSAKLVAPSAGRRAAYEWEYSVDGGKTWLPAPATLQARTIVTGLPPGSTVSFRYRSVLKTGESDWSLPTSVMVK
jgi:hypothetical protein